MVLFLKTLLNMSFNAGFVILVVIVVRWLFVLIGVPKRYACLLWILPLIRLLCPWSPESRFCLMPDMNQVAELAQNSWEMSFGAQKGASDKKNENVPSPEDSASLTGNTGESMVNADKNMEEHQIENNKAQAAIKVSESEANASYGGDGDLPEQTADTKLQSGLYHSRQKGNSFFWGMFFIIWLAGVAAITGHSIYSLHNLKKRLSEAFLIRDNVYSVDDLETAFVIGFRNPLIYLPYHGPEQDMEYIITHEEMHIRYRDHWIKAFAFFVTAVYWFHPLCWVAFSLLGKDMEMSCDEKVLESLGMENKKAYANVLLSMATGKMQLAGMPLAFAEGSPKSRIKNIMNYKKPMVFVTVLSVALVLVLAVVLLTSPGNSESSSPGQGFSEASTDTEEIVSEENQRESASSETLMAEEPMDNPDNLPMGEIAITAPLVTVGEDGGWGADFVELVYATPNCVVAYGHMGLFVYSVDKKKLTGAVNVKAIGCDYTQGDMYTDVFVADQGGKVYLHTNKKDYMFVYDIFNDTLEKKEFVDGGDGRPEGVKVDDIRQETISAMGDIYPQHWVSSECVVYTDPGDPEGNEPDRKYLLYLQSSSNLLSDLSYVVVEWDEKAQAWSKPQSSIWTPYNEKTYPIFEGEGQELLWELTEDSRMYSAKAVRISQRGLTLGLYNCSDKEITYGENYRLYAYDEAGTLHELKASPNVGFHDIAHCAVPKSVTVIPIDWSLLYGMLPLDKGPVKYRLVKEIRVPKSEASDADDMGTENGLGDVVEVGVDFIFPEE